MSAMTSYNMKRFTVVIRFNVAFQAVLKDNMHSIASHIVHSPPPIYMFPYHCSIQTYEHSIHTIQLYTHTAETNLDLGAVFTRPLRSEVSSEDGGLPSV